MVLPFVVNRLPWLLPSQFHPPEGDGEKGTPKVNHARAELLRDLRRHVADISSTLAATRDAESRMVDELATLSSTCASTPCFPALLPPRRPLTRPAATPRLRADLLDVVTEAHPRPLRDRRRMSTVSDEEILGSLPRKEVRGPMLLPEPLGTSPPRACGADVAHRADDGGHGGQRAHPRAALQHSALVRLDPP